MMSVHGERTAYAGGRCTHRQRAQSLQPQSSASLDCCGCFCRGHSAHGRKPCCPRQAARLLLGLASGALVLCALALSRLHPRHLPARGPESRVLHLPASLKETGLRDKPSHRLHSYWPAQTDLELSSGLLNGHHLPGNR